MHLKSCWWKYLGNISELICLQTAFNQTLNQSKILEPQLMLIFSNFTFMRTLFQHCPPTWRVSGYWLHNSNHFIERTLPWRSRTLKDAWPLRSSSVTSEMLLKERSRTRASSVTLGTWVNPQHEQLQWSWRSQRVQESLPSSVLDLWPQHTARWKNMEHKQPSERLILQGERNHKRKEMRFPSFSLGLKVSDGGEG